MFHDNKVIKLAVSMMAKFLSKLNFKIIYRPDK